MSQPHENGALREGQQVQFREGEEDTRSLGVISRVWENGKYVSLRSDGRLFVRLIGSVTPCEPCREPTYDHRRKSAALGITFDVPVCRCGGDIADHADGDR